MPFLRCSTTSMYYMHRYTYLGNVTINVMCQLNFIHVYSVFQGFLRIGKSADDDVSTIYVLYLTFNSIQCVVWLRLLVCVNPSQTNAYIYLSSLVILLWMFSRNKYTTYEIRWIYKPSIAAQWRHWFLFTSVLFGK